MKNGKPGLSVQLVNQITEYSHDPRLNFIFSHTNDELVFKSRVIDWFIDQSITLLLKLVREYSRKQGNEVAMKCNG